MRRCTIGGPENIPDRYFKHWKVNRMLCSYNDPVKIARIQFLAVSEAPACCCGLAHEVLDDQQYFAIADARSEILQPRDGGVLGRRREVSHRGIHVRRAKLEETVTATMACAHSRLELRLPCCGTWDASSHRSAGAAGLAFIVTCP